MDKRLFILTLMTAAALAAYAQTPLNRLDSFYFAGETEAASVYAEKVLNDPNQSASQKKAVSAYLEMRRFLTDATLSGREKRTGLDACLPLAEEAVTSEPVCLRRRLVRAGVEPHVCRQYGSGIFLTGSYYRGKRRFYPRHQC